MRASGAVLVAAVLAAAVAVGDGALNPEVGKRASDLLLAHLGAAYFPSKAIGTGVRTEVVTWEGALTLQSFVYTLARASARIRYSYVALSDGRFLGFRTNGTTHFQGLSLNTIPVPNATCAHHTVFPCLSHFAVNALGQPEGESTSNTQYEPRQRPWYQERISAPDASGWGSPYVFAQGGEVGITFTERLANATGAVVGVSGVDVELSSLGLLLEEVAQDGTESSPLLFVMDPDRNLLASSEGAAVMRWLNSSRIALVRAIDSENRRIAGIAKFLDDNWFEHDTVYERDDESVQTVFLSDRSASFTLVVVSKSGQSPDRIHTNSTEFVLVCFLGSLSLLSTLFLAVWVPVYRALRVWRLAQPPVLMLILFANLLCTVSCFLMLGDNSNALCTSRLWVVVVATCLSLSSLLGKIERVREVGESTTRKSIPVESVFKKVGAVMAVVVVLLVVWTAVDPFEQRVELERTGDNVWTEHVYCRSQDVWGAALVALVVFALFAWGMRLSFRTRNYSSLFAESNTLLVSFYHGLILLVVLVIVSQLDNTTDVDMYVWTAIAMVWFTLATQLGLFWFRVVRQVTRGDLTQGEYQDKVRKHSVAAGGLRPSKFERSAAASVASEPGRASAPSNSGSTNHPSKVSPASSPPRVPVSAV